jgi:outer membrane receptor protein involved in Fe transport
MIRRGRRHAGAVLALLAIVSGTLPGTARAETLVNLLERLRAAGFNVIYSSDLVRPDMQVPDAPATTDLLAQARAALAARGLELRSIGNGQYIVTQAAARPNASPPPSPPAQPAPAELQEISVYASRYQLGGEDLGEPRLLTATQIEQVPGSQNDALRATRVIPGVVTNISTRPYIRGSFADDILVQFDGVPLADPYHLKNFQSLISAFDPSAVERIEVFSGGFPVRYGTKSGGVLEVTPRALDSGYEHAVGASLVAYDAASVGHAEKWPIDWLATVRHSVPDVVIKPVNASEGEPEFLDSLGRVRWHSDDDSAWTLGWLLLQDRLDFSTQIGDEATHASYRDEYWWAAYETSPQEALHSRTVLASSWAERERSGILDEPGIAAGSLQESRESSSVDLRSLWTYQASPRMLWTYSFEAGHAHSDLHYDRRGEIDAAIAASFGRSPDNTLIASAAPSETTYAASAAARRRWSNFEAELGVRLDVQRDSSTGLRHEWSPRLNVRQDFADRWHLYGSWGRFTQPQRVDEWRMEERQTQSDPSALAVHTILGVSHDAGRGTRFSVEAYRKRWTEVRPYFDNLFDTLSLVPDLQPDRVRVAPRNSEAAGIEVSARRTFAHAFEGWAAYAYSRVSDDFETMDDIPRSWDQRNALTLGLAWNARPWTASLVLGWHTGWPHTPSTYTPATASAPSSLVIGRRNDARWDDYFSADLSGSWTHAFSLSELSLWFELTNGTNRPNECCVHFITPSPTNGQSLTEPNYYLPRTLNVGFNLRFRDRR